MVDEEGDPRGFRARAQVGPVLLALAGDPVRLLVVDRVPDRAGDVRHVGDVVSGKMLGQEGRQFRGIFLYHPVSLADEPVVVLPRFVEPVDVFLAEDAGLLEGVLHLGQVPLHQAVVLPGPLLEPGEDAGVAVVECPAPQALQAQPETGEAIFPEVFPCSRDELREVKRDVDGVRVHLETSGGKEIPLGVLFLQHHVVEPDRTEVVP